MLAGALELPLTNPAAPFAAQQDSPYDLKLHTKRVKDLGLLLHDSGINVQQFHSQFSLAADPDFHAVRAQKGIHLV